ncbi:MAG: undecaprenyl-phosphate glucose phosphotransferase [Paludibacteraceae bacterium]|nr:undecaprenyl-phosphate glucose phosphotransferase [Paludibacteraceae bacterium]MBN2787010.1 undecaprenyl-phosphate glucose phosphotransferase [Paludibacteraceae bacterium]
MRNCKNSSVVKFIAIFGEIVIINCCYFLAFYVGKEDLSHHFFIKNNNFLLFFNLSYFIALSQVGIILHRRIVNLEEIVDRVIKLSGLHFIVLLLLIVLSQAIKEVKFSYFLTLFFSCLTFILLWRFIFLRILRIIRIKEKFLRPIIIVGSGNIAIEFYNRIVENKANGYKLLGIFDDKNDNFSLHDNTIISGKLNEVIPFLNKNKQVEEIFCTLNSNENEKVLSILSYAENNFVRFYLIPDFKKFLNKKVRLQFFNNIPIISLRREPLDNFINAFIKRSFDLVFSILFLLTVFPILLLIIGIAVKINSKGPIFFLQKRTGKNGKTFTCIKFRSMQVNKEADLKQAQKGDNRITRIGVFLRKTNLDETPQFINVLMGDMTIVGPRPHMIKHTEEYAKLIDKYMLRHLGKPGITGWAQVSGHRGETKNIREMEKRVIRDVWYLENWTFGLDLRIIFRTIYLMLKGDETAY